MVKAKVDRLYYQAVKFLTPYLAFFDIIHCCNGQEWTITPCPPNVSPVPISHELVEIVHQPFTAQMSFVLSSSIVPSLESKMYFVGGFSYNFTPHIQLGSSLDAI